MERTPDERRPQFAVAAKVFVDMAHPDAILARMRADWGPRVSDFAGVELNVGETRISESEFGLPNNQEIPYLNVTRLEALIDCDGGRCARLTYRYDTDASALEDFAGEALKDLGGEAPGHTKVSGSGERVIDPATMLIRTETQRRIITMESPGADGTPVRGIRNETREYTYDYAPAPAAN
jgi:hypothetical protein